MDVYEALYTTRSMRRILDAAIRAPNGGNTQRWYFLVVDDPDFKRTIGDLYRNCSELEHEAFGYPLGRWGVAANHHPVHDVSSRNRWSQPLAVEAPQPLFGQVT